jgi:hypothetical protein
MTSPGARIIAESNDIYKTDSPYYLAYQAYNLLVQWHGFALDGNGFIHLSKAEFSL